MKAVVTGATGHIGSHVVRAAIDAGMTPVALARAGSDRRGLAGLDVEVREADLLDPATLQDALEGADVVFHVASPHRNFALNPQEIIRPAVEGTRNVLEAARSRAVQRVVVTSSAATVGFAPDPTRPLDESSHLDRAASPYTQSKIEAERLAMRMALAGGPEVVVVNPSGVFGPGDYRITPASQALVGILQGDPAMFYVSVTDVRDVAAGHVRAAERGEPGKRYLLTGDLLSPTQLGAVVHELSSVRPKAMRPPRWLLGLVARVAERRAARAGTDASITRALLDDVYGKHLAYDSKRARDELGARFRPAADVLRDAFRWLLFVDALKPKVAERLRSALGASAAPDPDWRR
jgi:dihydroflavonol-4-reductase